MNSGPCRGMTPSISDDRVLVFELSQLPHLDHLEAHGGPFCFIHQQDVLPLRAPLLDEGCGVPFAVGGKDAATTPTSPLWSTELWPNEQWQQGPRCWRPPDRCRCWRSPPGRCCCSILLLACVLGTARFFAAHPRPTFFAAHPRPTSTSAVAHQRPPSGPARHALALVCFAHLCHGTLI